MIKGTRLTVEFLPGLLAEEWTFDLLLENYPGLTGVALKALFAFGAETLGDESRSRAPTVPPLRSPRLRSRVRTQAAEFEDFLGSNCAISL